MPATKTHPAYTIRNVTASMGGLKNGHIGKNLTKMVNPRDVAGNAEKKKKEDEEDLKSFW